MQALLETAATHAGLGVQWVRGHNGHPLNEAADRLATTAARDGEGRRVITGPGWITPA